jgi:homoserine dehydrogenase
MINIAIIGGGVVGSGVFELLEMNSEIINSRSGKKIIAKWVLDIKKFDPNPYGKSLTSNPDDVFGDPSISIIVETMGGCGAAYEFTKRGLASGRHVVTSNKELVAGHGPELLKLAKANGVHYLFEASVGGGIPIIRPLNHDLAANEINSIIAILNGTTNYILTQMRVSGKSFAEALREAKANGYAEADPTSDIEGYDSCRKLAILSSIAFGQYVECDDIFTEGISGVTPEDIQYAHKLGKTIKLVARSRKENGKVYVRVSPLMIGMDNPLANVEDVFNAILLHGNSVGDVMFYGQGAGKLPTASAVAADVIDIVRHPNKFAVKDWEIPSEGNIVPIEECDVKMFVRVMCEKKEHGGCEVVCEKVEASFGKVEYINPIWPNEVVFCTDIIKEGDFKSKIAAFDLISAIRVHMK